MRPRLLKSFILASLCALAVCVGVTLATFLIWAALIGTGNMENSPGSGVGALGLTALFGLIMGAFAFVLFLRRFLAGRAR